MPVFIRVDRVVDRRVNVVIDKAEYPVAEKFHKAMDYTGISLNTWHMSVPVREV